MALNPSITQLDSAQIVKRTYDGSNDAIRTIPADSTSFAVAIDSASGDNIAIKGLSFSTKVSLTSASSGDVISAFDISGYKSFNLYTNTTSTITGAQACTLYVSPSDTDNVWVATTLTVTPSTTNGTVVMGTANSAIVARRAKVTIASTITSGTFDLYIVGQGD